MRPFRVAALAALALVGSRFAAAGQDAGRPPTTSPNRGDRLPEDPVEGAKATAQWRAHLVREERDRKLHYDRERLKQHRALLRLLASARARYDRARTPAAVDAARARLPATAAEASRRMTAIDHWGVNSNLLEDYDAILKILGDEYPAARKAALAGDPAPLERLREALRARDQKMTAWLDEAAASRDE